MINYAIPIHFENDRFIHVVCAPKKEYLAILTAYIPSLEEWHDNYKRRKR